MYEALKDYHKRTKATHYHSSLSVLPILLEIKEKMRETDVCILSKAHAVSAYHLVFKGPLPDEPLVQGSFGSLGTGLPFAVGVAFMRPKDTVYVVMGDGEWDEGSNVEALGIASELGLYNLRIYIDKNGMKGMKGKPRIKNLRWNAPDGTPLVFLRETYKGPSWECHYWGPE